MDRKLHSLLSEHKAAIVERWYDAIIGTYPADTAKFFRKEQDQIANPVGQNIASAARIIVEELLRDSAAPTEKLSEALDTIVRIRAVQQFSAGRAVSFVFALKEVVEQELGAVVDGELRGAFRGFERLVDNLALHAFEIYAGCRERLHEIRLKEMKRKTYKLVERINAMPPRTRLGRREEAGQDGRVLKLSEEAPDKKDE